MNSDHHIKESVLERIQRENIHMRPRTYFVLRIAGALALGLGILIVSILICNFLFFTIRLNGHDILPALGGRGFLLFIQLFPWNLLAIDVLLIVLLRFVVREFKFAYRKSWLYTIIVLSILSIIVGMALDRGTSLNDRLLQSDDDGHLPGPFHGLYSGAREEPHSEKGEYRGTIVAIGDTFLLLDDAHDATDIPIRVVLPKEGPDAGRSFSIGDIVVVLGDHEEDGNIYAVAIHPLDPQGLPPHPRK
jgi:hypothetical protein